MYIGRFIPGGRRKIVDLVFKSVKGVIQMFSITVQKNSSDPLDVETDNLACGDMLSRNGIDAMKLSVVEALDLLFFCTAKWPRATVVLNPTK